MIRGLNISAMGMEVQAKRLDVLSNNMANANTTGYKSDITVVSSFEEVMISAITKNQEATSKKDPIGTITMGTQIDGIYTNFQQGSVQQTGRSLDLALQGEGYFEVLTPDGLRYTRDGSFLMNKEGEVVTRDGYQVSGSNGVITLDPNKEITITMFDEIYQEGVFQGKLQTVDFKNRESLKKIGTNLYEATQESIPFEGAVLQGYLEQSNVNIVDAMVEMITVSRAYEANQKMVQVHDSLLAKIVNEV